MAEVQSAQITTPETSAFPPGTELGADGLPVEKQAPVVPDKFKNADGSTNVEALLASYSELEKKQSAPAEKKEGEQPPTAEGEKPAEKAEPSAEEKAAAETLKSKGLELAPFNEEFAKDGKLSDDSYSKLEKAGFSKDMVDTYIAGVQAQNAANEATIADIKSVAGGDEGYANMLAWAKASMDAKQINEFNEQVSGSPAVAKLAVQNMKAAFDAAEGREPALIGGTGKPSGEVFRSWVEVETAMKDPRYGVDPAYTKSVEQKAIRSKI